MSGVKRKRNVLNVKQKLEILQKLDNGESASTDAEDVLNEGNTFSHSATLQSVETLLDYMDKEDLITVTLLRRKDGRLKLPSYGLPFHEFRPRFVLFPIVGTGRIDVARGLVSASVASRVMAVNSSHVKGTRRRQRFRSLERCRGICQATLRRNGAIVRNSTDHKYEPRATRGLAKPHAVGTPQVRAQSDSRFGQATRCRNKALDEILVI
ncbi:hypothetical protein AVEN_72217-1 [Araneus ventricosus]|uniref:HTH psq-type domain-containing protein n=1 Tax=Araneus ventricosus TaxID=182803 RepID=A0A4Y2TGL4_ARAVE|nr:hypothetical protein AVEN_72217-1 [Araneus ventricosus]